MKIYLVVREFEGRDSGVFGIYKSIGAARAAKRIAPDLGDDKYFASFRIESRDIGCHTTIKEWDVSRYNYKEIKDVKRN